MNTISINKGNVRMIAHMGLAGLEMKNTIAGFVAAGNRSYYGIETDIRVTKDQQFVVFHDANAIKNSGIDLEIEDVTLEELQAIPLYDMEEGVYRTDLRMPCLNEYIRICKKYEKKAVLELKAPMDETQIQRILEIIEEEDYLDEMIFISLYWDNLTILRRLLPTHPIQFVTRTWEEDVLPELLKYKIDLNIRWSGLTKELVELLHAKGIKVNCWVVDEKEMGEEMVSWGIDYITTNILE